ncbi:MAG: tRNA(Ile)-lysidine synthase [Candidatus Atribacteria bacterium]|nr:tRNA(Ile)-lysidine synthase [Candidatus Atribacteria bacterium]
MVNLTERILSCTTKFSLLLPCDKVLIAFSGGPDSTALVEILSELQEKIQFELALFHLNHLLRGWESDRDEKFCVWWAKQKGIPIFVERNEVTSQSEANDYSIEELARKVRYQVMEAVADQWGATRIALGHTLDDQVETVCMNILRGTGLTGLRGMSLQEGRFIRPLLETTKAEISQFLDERGIPFVHDSSNWDVSFWRNRVRHLLIPYLENNFNPQFSQAIYRLSQNAGNFAEQIEPLDIDFQRKGDIVCFSLNQVAGLSQGQLFLTIRSFIREFRGDLWDITQGQIKQVAHLIKRGKGEITLPGKAKIWIKGGMVCGSFLNLPLVGIPPWNFPLSVPGRNLLPEVGIVVESCFDFPKPIKGAWKTALNWDSCQPPFSVRNFQDGDLVFLKGKYKKLKEVWQEKGVIAEWRKSIPLICDREKIIWIPGFFLDERAIVRENSKHVIHFLLKKYKR